MTEHEHKNRGLDLDEVEAIGGRTLHVPVAAYLKANPHRKHQVADWLRKEFAKLGGKFRASPK